MRNRHISRLYCWIRSNHRNKLPAPVGSISTQQAIATLLNQHLRHLLPHFICGRRSPFISFTDWSGDLRIEFVLWVIDVSLMLLKSIIRFVRVEATAAIVQRHFTYLWQLFSFSSPASSASRLLSLKRCSAILVQSAPAKHSWGYKKINRYKPLYVSKIMAELDPKIAELLAPLRQSVKEQGNNMLCFLFFTLPNSLHRWYCSRPQVC